MDETLCPGTLESYRSQALELARVRIAGVADATALVKTAALKILALALDTHGHDPARAFPLAREALGTWPIRRYKPRENTKREGPLPEDPYKGNARVAAIRARLGHATLATVQKAQALLRDTALLDATQVGDKGRLKGRGSRRAPTAWTFGTEIADALSKAFFRFRDTRNQQKADQKKAERLSDFWKRSLGKKLAATVQAAKVQGKLAVAVVTSTVTKAVLAARALDPRPKSPTWVPQELPEQQQALQELSELEVRPKQLSALKYVRPTS